MNRYEIRNAGNALAYLLDCTLATVQSLAMKKSRPAGEYKRQIEIAQIALDSCNKFDVNISSTRGIDVKNNFSNSVEKYAKSYERN